MRTAILALGIAICLSAAAHAGKLADMPVYESRYYTIHSDLDPADLPAVQQRMTRMAEEYHLRTREFAGAIKERLPFFLFKRAQDYYSAGGPPGSDGAFNGEALMAIAGEHPTGRTWHIVQHEGFHQFIHSVIGGKIPIWLNEGLAEYFGESIYTGDGFVSGLIPSWRLARVKKELAENRFRPLVSMMQLSHAQWNAEMALTNYDEAWMMVQFLAHAEDGKYQSTLGGFIVDLSHDVPWQKAWDTRFGDPASFEPHWRQYWEKLPEQPNPTQDRYAQVTAATLTSFLARAYGQKQSFASFDAFTTAASAGQLKAGPEDRLPEDLLDGVLEAAPKLGTWSLEVAERKPPRLVGVLEDGTRVTGSFLLKGQRVDTVAVDLDRLGTALKEARDLLAAGKKDPARKLLQDAIRRNPRSSLIPEARKLLAACASQGDGHEKAQKPQKD